MKETVNVNIGSVAFTLDKDACPFEQLLRRHPPPAPRRGCRNDGRYQPAWRRSSANGLPSPIRVTTIEVVRATMAQMGDPSDFGGPATRERRGRPANERLPGTGTPRKLTVRGPNASIARHLGGLGAFFDTEPQGDDPAGHAATDPLRRALRSGSTSSSGSSSPKKEPAPRIHPVPQKSETSRLQTTTDTSHHSHEKRAYHRRGLCGGLYDYFEHQTSETAQSLVIA